MSENLLEVKNLKTYFFTDGGVVKSVDDVSFNVKPGKTLGVVGESGCGKSITSLSIMQLVETPPGKIVDGEIIYNGENLLNKDKDEMRKIRGSEIAMIFQEPMTSLNPVFTVGQQIMEALMIHTDMDKTRSEGTCHRDAETGKDPVGWRSVLTNIRISYPAVCVSVL